MSRYSKSDAQLSAFDKLNKLKVGALFMEMGTGKTRVALDLMASKQHKVDYMLWVCPCSLKNEIEAERQKWHPEIDINVVGCESLGSSDRIYLNLLKKTENKKIFMVVDESLKIKNINAKRTKRILFIGERATYKLILNGTPISKNVVDLWTQMNFLSPKILDMNYLQFKNTFCEYYKKGKLKNLVKDQVNIEYLISLIKPYIFDAELDLNKNKSYHSDYYEMDLDTAEEYEEIKNDFLWEYEQGISELKFFKFLTRLQICYTKCYKKQLQELIEHIAEPVIIFVKYVKNIPADALRITGEKTIQERKEIIEKFKKEGGALYITYGCGAYGLNLQFCHNMIFVEHSFDYAQRIQAEARIYRIGQERDVDYYELYCTTGLEKMIEASINKKTLLLYEIKKEIENQGIELIKKL